MPREPRIGIEAIESDGNYIFSFANCRTKHTLTMDSVSVYEQGGSGLRAEPICRLVATHLGTIWLEAWTYGTAPAGFRMESCAPLSKEHVYEVRAFGTKAAVRKFYVGADSGIAPRGPYCDF